MDTLFYVYYLMNLFLYAEKYIIIIRMPSIIVPVYTIVSSIDDKIIGTAAKDIAIEKVVARGGLEPPTQGFSVLCSTN